ncbi:peptidyl-prolyl cis-trans isomerase [Thermosipho ferrireducens]|uniref:Peptidyl-prolyl cis-trans isomerase n=1 Tax=Thermosipho ferrireducens TaxID=2571116 RepID=A0ABX7S788_9BACT|nr:peptidyl-prolyl cis-trans isomerase [Thermosipho ferrireducens]QTA37128.1 peptidyl-prolyl cis-trans isomerase [Thermosipho ferrireducens]
MKKFFMVVFLIGILSTTIFAVDTSSKTATTTTSNATTVVALVNGEPITLDILNSEANIQNLLISINQVNETFFNVLTNTQEGINLIMRYKRAVLDNMVQKLLIVQFAQKYNLRPSDIEVTNLVNKQVKEYLTSQGIDEQTFDSYLKYANMGSLEDFKKRLYFNTLVNLSLKNLYDFVAKNATVTNEEIKIYYENNITRFSTPAQYDLYLLNFNSNIEANAAKQKLLSGESFENIAGNYGINNPLLEKIEDGNKLIPEKIWNYIRNSLPGSILGPIEADGKYYLIRLLNVIPAQTKKLEDVKNDIISIILNEKQSKIWAKFIDNEFSKFKQQSDIKIFYNIETKK